MPLLRYPQPSPPVVTYVGIDPGISGAVAALREDGSLAFVEDIPVMANGKGSAKVKSQVNAAGLAVLLKAVSADSPVYLERVSAMPGQGVASMFSMGDTFGAIRGVCAVLGHQVVLLAPQSWKKRYGVGHDKEVARALAIQMYPDAPLHRKKDHNRAEAILIARYGRELFRARGVDSE